MAFTDKNKLGYSFKKSLNKAHTQENFSPSEEPISTNVSISYSTIFGENINPNPISNATLTDAGIVTMARLAAVPNRAMADPLFSGNARSETNAVAAVVNAT